MVSGTVQFVAATESAAIEGARSLENAAPELSVEAVTDVESVRSATDVDCLVFAEMPTSSDGSNLLEVREACPSVPLILFTESSYGAGVARSTDGIDGYVRRDGSGPYEYLADEIEWLFRGEADRTGESTSSGGADQPVTGEDDLAEDLADGVLTVDRAGRVGFANEWFGGLLGVDADALRGMPLDALAGAGTLSTSDVEAIIDAVGEVLGGTEAHLEREVTFTPEAGPATDVILRIAPRRGRDDLAVVSVRQKMVPPAVAAELRRRRERMARLHALSNGIVACRDERRLYELAVEAARDVLSFNVYSVIISEDGWLMPKATSTAGEDEPTRLYRDESLARETVETGRTFVVGADTDGGSVSDETGDGEPEEADHTIEVDRATAWPVPENARYPAGISVPIGEFGVFQAMTNDRTVVDDDEIELAELLCSSVGETIARIRAEDELRERRQAIARLHAGTARVVAAEDVEEACELVVDVAETVLEFDDCAVFLPDDDGTLVVRARRETDPERNGGDDWLSIDAEVAEAVVESGSPVRRGRAKPPEGARSDAEIDSGHGQPGGGNEDRSEGSGGSDDRSADSSESGEQGEGSGGSDDRSGGSSGSDGRSEGSDSKEWRRERSETPVGEPDGGNALTTSEQPVEASMLCVPIGDDGALQSVVDRPDAYDDDDVEVAELLAAHARAVVDRLRTEAELVSEHERLSALFHNVPDPAVRYEFVDGDAIARDVNSAFETVFGLDREEILDADVDEYIVPPGYEAEASELNAALMAGETLQTETRRQTTDEVRDFLIHVVPLDVGERSVEGFGIYTDITDQKRRERELRAQNERLDEFAGIVSHDLRNPLNVARGYLELVEETHDEEHFEEIDDAHERMAQLIDDLLTLAQRGEVIAEIEPVGLHDVARRAWSTVHTNEATLSLGEDAIFEADVERLVEVLENLMRNAIEHGGDEGAVEITVGATADGFYVADDGSGIPSDDREVVFESGYTTNPDGTGFGLSIVSQIAEAHGWSVSVGESERGGARFDFSNVTTGDVGP